MPATSFHATVRLIEFAARSARLKRVSYPRFWAVQFFFKKKLARVKAVRIMRDLGGGTLPAKDLPERQVC